MAREVHHGRHAPRRGIAFDPLPPVVVDLADVLGVVSLLLEDLGQRDEFGVPRAKVGRQIPDVKRVRPAASQERRPRRVADRLLAVGGLEQRAAGREPVEARRANERIAVAAQVGSQVVSRNEKHVRPRPGESRGRHDRLHRSPFAVLSRPAKTGRLDDRVGPRAIAEVLQPVEREVVGVVGSVRAAGVVVVGGAAHRHEVIPVEHPVDVLEGMLRHVRMVEHDRPRLPGPQVVRPQQHERIADRRGLGPTLSDRRHCGRQGPPDRPLAKGLGSRVATNRELLRAPGELDEPGCRIEGRPAAVG